MHYHNSYQFIYYAIFKILPSEDVEKMSNKLHYGIRGNSFVFPINQVCLIKFALIMSVIVLTGSGCAFSKYKMAKKDAPPPVEMNLKLDQPPVDFLLHSVIIYKGPGSWKREAYWDEYIVSIANRGSLPLFIESATLVDFQDKYNSAGCNPWELEKQSKAWWKGIRANGISSGIAIGAGMTASGLAFVSGLSGGVWTGYSISGIGVAGAAGLVALPVVGVSYIVGNLRGHKKIEKEFDRRRMVLPAVIQTGKIVKGSLFFPITAGPKCLIINYKMGEEEYDMTFALSPLKTLHFKEKETGSP